MNILADTHILLWSLYDDSKLSSNARKYLSDGNNHIFYSLISVWEVEIKHSIGKMPVPSDEFIKDMDGMGYIPLNLKKEHIQHLQTLGDYSHKDPFDRLLLAQALSEHYHFLTQDEKILAFPSELLL